MERVLAALKRVTPPWAAALATAIVLSVVLLCPPLVGMADNGDFYRISNGLGLYKLDRDQPDQYFSYFAHEYGVYQYFDEYDTGLISTQTPLILLSKGLCALFTSDPTRYDIRFMSGILILWSALAAFMLTDYVSFGRRRGDGYAAAALCVFFFADTGYSAYMNSFFAEGLVLVSFLTMAAALLLISQRRYNVYALLALAFFNGLTLTGAKQQNAPIGVLLALVLAVLAWRMPVRDKGYIEKPLRFRVTGFAMAGLIAFAGVAVYALIPQEFVDINQYHAMTRGVMMTSENPEETLEEFDIDEQFAILNKTIYYDRYPTVDVQGSTLTKSFYDKFGFVPIAKYYLTHPDKLMMMLDIAARSAYSIRSTVIGNFERGAGYEPGARAGFFTLHSTLKNEIVPKTVGFMVIWTGLALFFARKNLSRLLMVGFIVLIGLSQIGVAVVGAGDADISKHVFLYNVSFDLINFLALSAFITGAINYTQKKMVGLRAWRRKKAAQA